MKSLLIEDVVEFKDCQTEVRFNTEDGKTVQGWAIAKPLNFSNDCLDEATKTAWIEEIKAGRAIAVHFTEDEIAAGEVPTLYKRHISK